MGKYESATAGQGLGSYSAPVIQVRKNSVVLYYEPLRHRHRLNNRKTWQKKDLHKDAYQGKVTLGVRKRLTKAVNLLLQMTKPTWVTNTVTNKLQYHNISFITLKITGGQNITGRQAYDTCFGHFLDWLTRTNGTKLYVWKLEKEKSGQVHYHITTPDFIDYRLIRDKWTSLLRTAGFLDRYAKDHKHFHANSTDIHEVSNVTNLAPYIIKALADNIAAAEKIKKTRNGKDEQTIGAEMGKDDQNETATDGKIWGCSELLSASSYVTFACSDRHLDAINVLKDAGKVREITSDQGSSCFWAVWYFNDCGPPDILSRAEKLHIDLFMKWQLQRPNKAAEELELSAWSKRKPFLN
jgi:hypothetical protein